MELKDDQTLRENNIMNESTLKLHVAVRQIFVDMPSGNRLILQVELGTSIRDIKSQIQDKEDSSPDNQCLKFMGMPLEDDYTLRDYNVPNEATLHLGRMKIHVVMPNGNVADLDVLPSDSVEIVEKKICEKERINHDQLTLTFDDKQLEYGCSLGDYNIREGSVLYLKRTGM